MKRLALLGVLAGCMPLAASAHAATPTQTITVVNRAGVSPRELAKVERAVAIQSRELRHWWHTPVARFGPGGWPIYLHRWWPGNDHEYNLARERPWAEVSWTANEWPAPSVLLSHEVLEMLADPTARSREVCDPVAADAYRVGRVMVSDFVTPRWFVYHGRGPWDQMRRLTRAGETG